MHSSLSSPKEGMVIMTESQYEKFLESMKATGERPDPHTFLNELKEEDECVFEY